MKTIAFHRNARTEFSEAIAFYESRKQGLGLEFHSEVKKTVATIADNPKLGSPYKSTEFRFFPVHRFPFVVYYTEQSDIIWIVAIAHGRRRPGYWRRRKIS